MTVSQPNLTPPFRRLDESEVDTAHRLITEATEWLLARGNPQWSAPLPRGIVARRQTRGELFGLFEAGELIATVSLLPGQSSPWTVPEPAFAFLSTLAVGHACHGRGLGAACLLAALQHLAVQGLTHAYLDCMDHHDALPAYYRHLGFVEVERRTDPAGRTDVLFKRGLGLL